MTTRSLAVATVLSALFLGACSDDGPGASPTPEPAATASASAVACLPFDGPPDGTAGHPYLKRAMALTCREDVKRVQQALGIKADGFFKDATATAVTTKQKEYPCITATDGQVGQQTWALIVDGVEPCKPGKSTPAARPSWARCGSGDTAAWALRAADDTVLRRCADSLELVHDGKTTTGAVQELGSSVCAEFDESFMAPAGTRTTMCVSDPATDDTMQASPNATDPAGSTVWDGEVTARYVPD